MGESMKCSRCEEDLIREELEDQEFLDQGRILFGESVCVECFYFEKPTIKILAGVCG